MGFLPITGRRFALICHDLTFMTLPECFALCVAALSSQSDSLISSPSFQDAVEYQAFTRYSGYSVGWLTVLKAGNQCWFPLKDWLDLNSYSDLYVCGITTNHCCETTARMAGNLGYNVKFVLDATRTFDFKDLAGNLVSAESVYQMTATNLSGEFAEVVLTSDITI